MPVGAFGLGKDGEAKTATIGQPQLYLIEKTAKKHEKTLKLRKHRSSLPIAAGVFGDEIPPTSVGARQVPLRRR
jgi:hypothetical protein